MSGRITLPDMMLAYALAELDSAAIDAKRAGKTQAMLEAAVVESDRMLSLGIPNPIAVYCRKGRAEETRARLDAMGGARVAVQEVAACESCDATPAWTEAWEDYYASRGVG